MSSSPLYIHTEREGGKGLVSVQVAECKDVGRGIVLQREWRSTSIISNEAIAMSVREGDLRVVYKCSSTANWAYCLYSIQSTASYHTVCCLGETANGRIRLHFDDGEH